MSAISDAAFERDMRALHMRLGELCHYGQWHKEDPTMPLMEMIRYMTKLREEAEVEAAKRAMEDWAWEAEQMAEAEAEAAAEVAWKAEQEAEAEAAWEAAKVAWEAEQAAATPGEEEPAEAHEVEGAGCDSP